jgi:glycosyltransferase involved in cell wall biosynthesis
MASNPLHVLLLSTSNADLYMGGPVLTMRLLFKAKEESNAGGIDMSAVFSDRVISSYEELVGLSLKERTVRGALHLLIRLSLQTVGFVFRFMRTFRRLDRDRIVFHAHGLTPAYLRPLLLSRRYPLLLTFHGKGGHIREPIMQYPRLRLVEKFLRHVEISAVKRVDTVIFTSEGARALFESEYPNLLQGKDVRVVHTGVDLQELDSVSVDDTLLTKFGVVQGTFVLLCVAKLIEDKGVDTLIEAIALLPDNIRSRLSCLIVGRGQLEEELQSLIARKSAQDTIKIIGFLPRNQLLGLMKIAALFVLPSRVSVFDYALLEAGAMKVPIVTTAVGGNMEMFDQDSAILVPPGDPQALATAISRAVADQGLRKQLAESAYQRIRSRFSIESMFNSYLSIYEDMLGHSKQKTKQLGREGD